MLLNDYVPLIAMDIKRQEDRGKAKKEQFIICIVSNQYTKGLTIDTEIEEAGGDAICLLLLQALINTNQY